METPLQRLELLVGPAAIERLKQACVLIVGIGGVGGYAAEALGRSGIGKLILVDADTVAPSNLNRQIIATLETLNQSKTEVMAARIRSFAPECEVQAVNAFFNEQSESLCDQKIDYVIDAIDTLSSKLALIEIAQRHSVPCISSLGMANRFDPTQLTVTTLDKTCNDPLARALRQMVRKRGFTVKIPVVWSRELPRTQNQLVNAEGQTLKQKYPPASTIFVPAAAGLTCASVVFQALIEENKVSEKKD